MLSCIFSLTHVGDGAVIEDAIEATNGNFSVNAITPSRSARALSSTARISTSILPWNAHSARMSRVSSAAAALTASSSAARQSTVATAALLPENARLPNLTLPNFPFVF